MNNNDPMNDLFNGNESTPVQDDPNPFADYSNNAPENEAPVDFNPFVNQTVQEMDKEPKKKGGLFHRKKKEEDDTPQVTTITLKDVQSMSFPKEEIVTQQQVPVMPETFIDPAEKKNKRKRVFKRVKKILELVIIIGLIIFGIIKYRAYSKEVNQKLTYQYGNDLFEMVRDKNEFHVNHYIQECVEEDCHNTLSDDYNVSIEGIQKYFAILYFDFSFQLKNSSKTIKLVDLNTTLASKTVYSLIHNDMDFLSFNQYRDYTVINTEQKSDYTLRGYHYEERMGHFYLSIALGKKDNNGYDIKVIEAHKKGEELIIYVKETIPTKKDQWIRETQPAINLELNEPFKSIKVINVNNKEEFIGY